LIPTGFILATFVPYLVVAVWFYVKASRRLGPRG
jgi:hypothetical protein